MSLRRVGYQLFELNLTRSDLQWSRILRHYEDRFVFWLLFSKAGIINDIVEVGVVVVVVGRF